MNSIHQNFIKAGTRVVPLSSISSVDVEAIEQLVMRIVLLDGDVVVAEGIDALENAMLLKPSCLEGRRMRWAKRAWLTHNFVGHPLMQLLALCGLTKQAMWVHDHTVPKALGRHPSL